MKHEFDSAVKWFEIPVRQLDRAQTFYETVLGRPMRREAMGPHAMAIFGYDERGVGGCLISGADIPSPSATGSLVYLNAEPSLDAVLARVADAGGKVALGRTALPPGMGFFAHLTDPEGNRVGLHALA